MSELLRSINPSLASMLYPTRVASQASRRPPAPYVTDEEERSLVGSLRDSSLTAIGAVGNLLDLPGSMVRDVAAGQNPLDQLLSPLRSDNRTSGRDLARKYGLASGRDTWGNAIGGSVAEAALDPLTYLTLGGAALSRAGQAASKAGLMNDVGRVATKKAGVQSGAIGKRQARVSTTLDDILEFGDEAARSKAQAAIDQGANPEQKLGGLVGIGVPFMQPSVALGTGATAEKIARGVDTAARAVRFAKIPGTDFSPVNSLINLVDAPASDTSTPWGQEIARNHFMARQALRAEPRKEFARDANTLLQAGLVGDNHADMLRLGLEGVEPLENLPVPMREIVERARKQNREMPYESSYRGLGLDALTDDEVDYAARYSIQTPRHAPKRSQQIVSAYDPSEQSRLDFLRNVPGGTVNIKKLVQDKDLGALIDSGADVDAVAKAIEAKAGGWLPDTFKKFNKNAGEAKPGEPDPRWVERQGRYKAIAAWMGRLSPESRKAGVFGNHPLLDHQARRISFEEAVRGSETVADALAEPGVLLPASRAANAAADGSVTVGEMLGKLSLEAGDESEGFLQFLRGRLPDDDPRKLMKVKDLKEMRIDAKYAADLGHVYKTVSGPDAVNDILQFVDGITNFSKGMWTSVWPAFHARNIVSGQIQNAMLGMWDKESAKWAHQIQKGETLEGASKLPIVQQEWAKRVKAAPDPPHPFVGPVSGQGEFQYANVLRDGKTVGKINYGVVNIDGKLVGNIDDVSLRSDARGNRMMGDVLPEIERRLAAQGASEIRLNTVDDAVGEKVWRPLGFQQVGGSETKMWSKPISPEAIKKAAQGGTRLTDEEATRILGELAYAHEVIGKHDATRATDVAGTVGNLHSGDINDALTGIPRPGFENFSAMRTLKKATGMAEGTSLKPWDVRGVGDRVDSGFGPAAAGEDLGFYGEGLNRLAPFFNLLKKGYDPAEAARKVGAAQVVYSNRNYTPAEIAYFSRILPFYKFSRGQIPFHIKHLMEKPGGGYAQTVRLMNNAQSQGELAPDYVRDTASIPVDGSNPILSALIGEAPAGTDRYIAGFGLMNEDMLSLGPGVQGTIQEFLSRTNPLIKAPLEYAANQTFFQAGPEGGRDLDRLDPAIGRLIANVTGRDEPVQLPLWLEHAASNSPVARAITTARTLTDTRKRSDYGGVLPEWTPGPAALLNVLTGARVTDVSPGAKDAIVRDLLTRAMKDAGASTFERVYFPKEELAEMSEADQDLALQLQGLANVLAKRTKERKAEQDNGR